MAFWWWCIGLVVFTGAKWWAMQIAMEDSSGRSLLSQGRDKGKQAWLFVSWPCRNAQRRWLAKIKGADRPWSWPTPGQTDTAGAGAKTRPCDWRAGYAVVTRRGMPHSPGGRAGWLKKQRKTEIRHPCKSKGALITHAHLSDVSTDNPSRDWSQRTAFKRSGGVPPSLKPFSLSLAQVGVSPSSQQTHAR